MKASPPKECITIAILEKSSGRVCINGLKMEAGDVIIIDDSKPYDFVSSHHTFITVLLSAFINHFL